jgi:hypothetical protein
MNGEFSKLKYTAKIRNDLHIRIDNSNRGQVDLIVKLFNEKVPVCGPIVLVTSLTLGNELADLEGRHVSKLVVGLSALFGPPLSKVCKLKCSKLKIKITRKRS